MKQLFTLIVTLCLASGLYSCLDHRGLTPENPQGVRTKLIYFLPYGNSDLNSLDTTLATSLTEYSYDSMNRLEGVVIYSRSPYTKEAYKRTYRTTLAYDEQGRIAKETYIDEPGDNDDYTSVYNYQYDAMSRLTSISTEGSVRSYTYNAQNRVSSESFIVYDASGRADTLSFTTFELDAKNNINTSTQIYKSGPIHSLSKSSFTYDQVLNPYYKLTTTVGNPSLVYTPNNKVVQIETETDLSPNPTVPVTTTRTYNRTLEYKDGLLIKMYNPRDLNAHIYEYEKY